MRKPNPTGNCVHERRELGKIERLYCACVHVIEHVWDGEKRDFMMIIGYLQAWKIEVQI